MALLSRRSKTVPAPVLEEPQRPGAKGKATPKRSAARAERPFQPYMDSVAGGASGRGKDAKAARRAQFQADRAALKRGDTRSLPARDRGPERSLARDLVDSRRHLVTFFPLVAVISVFGGGLVTNSGARFFVSAATFALFLVCAFDAVLLATRVSRRVRTELPGGATKVRLYAVQRAVLPRRFRLPGARVAVGDTV